jgi:hypothetical protein
MRIFTCVLFAVINSSSPVLAAVEQCRFIQAKNDREACYDRQARALAARRTPSVTGNPKTIDSEQTTPEDDAMKRSLRSICRGC